MKVNSLLLVLILLQVFVGCGKIDPNEKQVTSGDGAPVYVYDKNGVKLGKQIYADYASASGCWAIWDTDSKALLPFDGNGIMCVMTMQNTASDETHCEFTTANCTGTCYTYAGVPKYTVMKGASGYYKADGGTTSVSINSYYVPSTSSCIANVTGAVTRQTTTSYTFPARITYPIPMPIYYSE